MRSVSVVIPAYQAERYLAEAIESVLGQGWPDLELIVVDDGSTDATAEVAGRFGDRLRLIRQPNQGPGPARNTGVAAARGELLAFCDADDRWTPGRLAAALAAIESHGVHGVFGRVRQFVTPELADRAVRLPDAPTSALLASALLITRAGFDLVGPYPTSRAPDVAWALAAQRSQVRIIEFDAVVLERRIHGGNLGMTESQAGHRARLAALKHHLDVRRNGSDDASTGGPTPSHPAAPPGPGG